MSGKDDPFDKDGVRNDGVSTYPADAWHLQIRVAGGSFRYSGWQC